METAGRTDRAIRGTGLLILLLCLAGGLRLLAARGALWLDEVWTLGPQVLGKVNSPGDVFLAIHHENNHYWNTLWAWCLGPGRAPTWYRWPSVLAGVATTWCGWTLGRRRSWPAAVCCAALLAGSYLLIHYGSEARGYALAIAGLLGGWLLRERLFIRPGWGVALAVAAVECAGLTAQPVFVCHLAGILSLAITAVIWGNASERRQGTRSLLVTIPTLVWLAWLYAVDLGKAFNAGGNLYSPGLIVRQTLSLFWGGPLAGPGLGWGAAVGAGLCVVAGVVLWRSEKPLVKYALVAGVLAPWAILVVESRAEVYPRYFLPGVACGLVLVGLACGQLWQRGGLARIVAAAVFWIFLACQGRHVSRLLADGRGNPDVVQKMITVADRDPAPQSERVEVVCDQVFRFETWLGDKRLAGPPRLVLIAPEQARLPPAEWLLRQRTELEGLFPESENVGPFLYRLQGVDRSAGLSGWSTGVYRRSR